MSMDLSKRIARLRKSLRSKKSPLRSPRVAQVAAVSLVVLMTVGALVFAAHEAAPPVDAAPAARAVAAVATKATSPAPAKKTNVVKARSADAIADATAVAQTPDAVTITGCLEQDHDTFKLKDTEGADAPKSRSWKTGFIRKRSSPVTIVDGTNRLKLGTHVGERVSVTGALVDRDLQGRSLQRVTASCE
jgi:hypothetical protein